MSVSAAYDPTTFLGNGSSTSFPVTWPFFSGSLLVTLISSAGAETVKTISTHYTVSGGTDANGLPATGTVTMLTAPATGESLRIERVTPRTQATVYSTNDAFPAKTTEAALDKLHLLMQEVLYETDRAIKLRTADREAGVDPVLPLVADQEGETFAINVDGDGVDLVDPSGLGLDIGTVTTGAAGTSAQATITGTAPDLLLNLTIPRGNTGASGAGSGDLVAANNLDDLADAPTALTNLGISAFAQTILDDADAAAARTTLGAQAQDAELAAIAGLASAADKVPYFTGSGAAAVADFTAAGRALVDDADAAAQRTTLGLGTAATLNVGTGASNVVQLDGSSKMPAVDGSQLTNLSGGKLVSRAYGSYTSSADLTTAIPLDDTIPQNTEGTEVVTASITPSSASNRVRVTFTAMAAGDDTDQLQQAIAALFRDSGADAIYATAVRVNTLVTPAAGCVPQVTADHVAPLSFVFEHSPSTTSSTTYKVRVGPNTGTDPIRLNGSASARRFGGVAAATLVLEELTP